MNNELDERIKLLEERVLKLEKIENRRRLFTIIRIVITIVLLVVVLICVSFFLKYYLETLSGFLNNM